MKSFYLILLAIFFSVALQAQPCLHWNLTGPAHFSDTLGESSCREAIAVGHNGDVYVAFQDYHYGNRVTVMKYNGTSWTTVGSPGFPSFVPLDIHSGGSEYVNNLYFSLAIGKNDTPFISFETRTGGTPATSGVTVMKYNGSDWVTLGSPFITSILDDIYMSQTNGMTLCVDANNNPYLSFDAVLGTGPYYSSAAVVMRFYDTSSTVAPSWRALGGYVGTPGESSESTMALTTTGVPYVAYVGVIPGGGRRITVKKYDGASWVNVGASYVSPNDAIFPYITMGKNDTPYVLFADTTFGSSVMKFDGTSWVSVGNRGFAGNYSSGVNITQIAIDTSNNIPYFYSPHYGTSSNAIVLKFDGTNWVSPAAGAFSLADGTDNYIAGGDNHAIAINKYGKPYIVYDNYSDGVSAGYFKLNVIEIDTVTIGAIAGGSNVCVGNTVVLTDGPAGGTWSSSSAAIATAGPAAGNVHGVAAGTATISYLLSPGCVATATVTVDAPPAAITITGTPTFCPGTTAALNETIPGGVWSSSAAGVATVGSTGAVMCVSGGAAMISYTLTNGCGTHTVTRLITVNSVPPTPSVIGGTLALCAGSIAMLTDSASGGVWSSSNTDVATINVSGIVTTVAAGMTTISYTVSNACGSSFMAAPLTVSAYPVTVAPISGSGPVCVGTDIHFTDATGGGTWSSSNAAVATVGTDGTVHGADAGMATITYTITNACGSAFATAPVTANAAPATPPDITGASSVCVGAAISLTDAGDGTWSSSPTDIATVDGSGVVSGASVGTAVISYVVSNSCGNAAAIFTVAVNSLPSVPAAITGSPAACTGATAFLSDATPGGSWSSAGAGVATISSSGIVSGATAGTAIISYTATNDCGSAAATVIVTINTTPAAPAVITGVLAVCAGATTTLGNATTGGTWSSTGTDVATVDGSGVVSGIDPATATISYTMANDCGSAAATATVTVNTIPVPPAIITGISVVCTGATTILSDATPGGTWSSEATGIATISSSGTVSGVTAGTTIISYTATNDCGSTAAITVVTVNTVPASPATITGISTACEGATAVLNDATPGGTWSSETTDVATVSSGGIVSGVGAGTTIISYTATNDCGSTAATMTFTVNALPSVAATAATASCGSDYVLSGSGAASYTWLPAAGLACTACATTTATTMTSATYTVTGTDGAGCSDTGMVTINANRIYGHISLAAPSADLKVWLIKYDPSDSLLQALDSTLTCSDGGIPYYSFSNKIAGQYLVKAMLPGGTPGSSGYIPTYGLSTSCWDTANVISHLGSTDTQHIDMIYATVPSGPGFISGFVYSGAGKGTAGEAPVVGMLIYLKDASGNVLTYTYTDVSGAYFFGSLAYGSYMIYPEDYSYYTTPSAVITLDASIAGVTNIDFKEHTNLRTITPFDMNTGISAMGADKNVWIYPNPASDILTIQLNKETYRSFVITNELGQEVITQEISSEKTEVHIGSLSAGMYYLTLLGDGGTRTEKFIKM